MLRLLRETTRNGHCFIYCQVTPQLVFTGARNFPRGQEVRFFKIFQVDGDFGIVEERAVSPGDCLLQLRDGQTVCLKCASPFEGDEAIRLYGQALVEFGSKREVDFKSV